MLQRPGGYVWAGLLALAMGACEPTPEAAPDPYSFAMPVRAAYLGQPHALDSAAYADRLSGALVGSAIGDAMGAGTEMWHRSEIRLQHGYITGLTPSLRSRSPEGPWLHNGAPGSTTDDTRWKQLTLDYLRDAGSDPTPERFAEFIADYYAGQLDLLAEDAYTQQPDRIAARTEQLDWMSEWARVAIAFRSRCADGISQAQQTSAYTRALSRFYGGEMSCAGLLYTPLFGLVAPTPDSAYVLAYRHTLFDQGYGKDIASLAAAMTNVALRTASIDSVLDVAYYVDPVGFGDSRLVGRIAASIAQETRTAVRRALDQAVVDTLRGAGGQTLRVPVGYPHSRARYVRQQQVYAYLERNQRAIPFHAGEVWQILVAGLAWGDGDFEDTMQFIVNYGRDNDTVAALAGAILGAQLGYAALPQELTEPVVAETRRGAGIELVVDR